MIRIINKKFCLKYKTYYLDHMIWTISYGVYDNATYHMIHIRETHAMKNFYVFQFHESS